MTTPSPYIRPDLADLPPYTRPPEPRTGVRLHMNEAPEDWPEAAKQTLLQRLAGMPFQQYPERQAELTSRMARRLGAPEGGVLLGPSSGALLDLIALAGLRPGDTVAIPEPGFSLYPLLARRHGGQVRPIPVGTSLPLDPWFQALDCRQLWFTLPNNPTGAWLDPDDLLPLLEAALTKPESPLIVIDEAYAEFAPRTARLMVDRFPNVLLLRTCSKALASASWRLGYVVGAPDLIARLAALQLPYSISAASLEALDVALDFAPAFEARIRDMVDRRDRMAEAFPESPRSAANFLLISPDPADALAEEGLLVRRLPGANAARVNVGDERATTQVVATLGRSPRVPGPRPPKRLLVLDVDGVLIDADRSFMEAVQRALAELRPTLPWSDDHFRNFKRVGGFNNDFRLAAGALALAESGDRDVTQELEAAVGMGFPHLESRIQSLEPEAQRVVQKHYAETVTFERPLITLEELRSLGWDLAILTGRPPEELDLAWKVLGFQLPAIADAAPHLRKPEPAGLLQWVDAFRAEEVVFVGDTRDDAAALRAARSLRPEFRWTFAGVGPDRDRFLVDGDLQAPTLRDLLPLLMEMR